MSLYFCSVVRSSLSVRDFCILPYKSFFQSYILLYKDVHNSMLFFCCVLSCTVSLTHLPFANKNLLLLPYCSTSFDKATFCTVDTDRQMIDLIQWAELKTKAARLWWIIPFFDRGSPTSWWSIPRFSGRSSGWTWTRCWLSNHRTRENKKICKKL